MFLHRDSLDFNGVYSSCGINYFTALMFNQVTETPTPTPQPQCQNTQCYLIGGYYYLAYTKCYGSVEVYDSYTNVGSIQDCLTICAGDTNCRSVNYVTAQAICQLGTSTESSIFLDDTYTTIAYRDQCIY
jgi:hypothetical protein